MIHHEVGKFYTYYIKDHNAIVDALTGAGYEVCIQPSGDISIMADGEPPEFFDDYGDDDWDDDWLEG